MPIDLAPHHQQLADEGYTIVENAIEPELIDALVEDVQRLEAELDSRPADNRFEGNRTTRTYNLLAYGEIWQKVPPHPVVLELIEGVLGAECLVSSLASISLGPGETAQVIHADDQVQPLTKPHVATVCNSMWALTDYFAGDANVDTIPAEMPKGSVLVWHGSTWHGGGANVTTDEVRIGVAMNYCAGFIRQQENQQLGIPTEVMATFSPQLRQLCGLGMYRGLTGNIEKKSPAELLYGDPKQVQLWDAEPIEAGR